MADLWSLERNLWTEGAEAFRKVIHPRAQMLFGPLPDPLRGDAITDTVAQAARWASVDIYPYDALSPPSGDARLLTYRATARRDGDTIDHRAHCASLWIEEAGNWRLLFHQQTAIEA